MEESKHIFEKPALTAEQHVHLLRQRGLIIEDENYAKHCLSSVGYYHFSAYMLSFQKADQGEEHHHFYNDIRFEDIVRIYEFDRKLRLLVIDAVERIEIALRARIIDTMSVPYDPHWYMNAEYFVPKFRHDEFLGKIKGAIGHDRAPDKIRDICIKHYYSHYNQPSTPPVWMVFEALSFSMVSMIFKNLNRSDKKRIAKTFDLPVTILESWLHSISYVRNLCAHHQRLWNRVFTIKPLIPTDEKMTQFAEHFRPNTKFYAQATAMVILLNTIAPDNAWGERLKNLTSEISEAQQKNMGFSENWQSIAELWG